MRARPLGILLIILFVGYYFYPWLVAPKIDSTYTIVVLAQSQNRGGASGYNIDKDGAMLFQQKFGCQIKDYPTETGNLNILSLEVLIQPQNIIEIGGLVFPTFMYRTYNVQEGFHPDVFWDNTTNSITSLNYVYPCNDNNDFGLIVRMINPDLRRYVIFIMGYSGFCSYGGCVLLSEHPELIQQNQYIIFKYVGQKSEGYRPTDNEVIIQEVG